MLETSKDLLYIVVAFAILWLTIFICWGIYYFVMILRQLNLMFKDFRGKINAFEEAIRNIREKFEHSAAYLGLLVEGVKKLVEYVIEKREKKGTEKKKAKIL